MNVAEARRIVRILRQGTVSLESATAISVGTGSLEKSLHSAFSRFEHEGSDGQAILIEGDWGGGKSHLSMLCRAILSSHRLAWIYDCVDGKGGSLSHPNRCIPNWLGQMRVGGTTGLRAVIESDTLLQSSVLEWAKLDNSILAIALRHALEGSEYAWLLALGSHYAVPDNARQRERALSLVFDTSRLIQKIFGGGIVLILDEVENVSREWDVRGRRRAYDTIAALSECPQIKLVLLVTPQFIDQMHIDNQRASQEFNWSERARRFLNNATTTPPIVVPRLNEKFSERLVQRVHDIYSISRKRPIEVEDLYVTAVQQVWERTATKSTRLLVRLTIHGLDLLEQFSNQSQINAKNRSRSSIQ